MDTAAPPPAPSLRPCLCAEDEQGQPPARIPCRCRIGCLEQPALPRPHPPGRVTVEQQRRAVHRAVLWGANTQGCHCTHTPTPTHKHAPGAALVSMCGTHGAVACEWDIHVLGVPGASALARPGRTGPQPRSSRKLCTFTQLGRPPGRGSVMRPPGPPVGRCSSRECSRTLCRNTPPAPPRERGTARSARRGERGWTSHTQNNDRGGIGGRKDVASCVGGR